MSSRFPDPAGFSSQLLDWYDDHARTLPWRVTPDQGKSGVMADPYHVWLSEVMLQQTTVATVGGYFDRFVDKWPDVMTLAAADEEEVLKAWAGLGYYSRAHNLKKCADLIAAKFDGCIPDTTEALRKLPGIGDYTSAAIAAIAFGRAEPVVDGNIERIVTRLCCIDTPLPKAKPVVRQMMTKLMPDSRPGDFVQAMMDLGAGICSPRNPDCDACPIAGHCKASKTDVPDKWPLKLVTKAKPERVGAAFVAINEEGAILLRKRKNKGLLAGMSEVPTTGWTAKTDGKTSFDAAPFSAEWQWCGQIRHTFTHFHLTLDVYRSDVLSGPDITGWWSNVYNEEALPAVFMKAIKKVLS